jgi:isoleucyl-tRNA synthetase
VIQDVPDPEIMVSFPIVDDLHNASFVAWTTTPWTLPSNLALCVNGNFDYIKVGILNFFLMLIIVKKITMNDTSNMQRAVQLNIVLVCKLIIVPRIPVIPDPWLYTLYLVVHFFSQCSLTW